MTDLWKPQEQTDLKRKKKALDKGINCVPFSTQQRKRSNAFYESASASDGAQSEGGRIGGTLG